ncbi:MAG: hypothetical protein DMG98_27430 [Acidobacteria bacterium]|nr:MAG: hypothetical protein DMG98_27430 [Acidobacteriota bacterium]
MRVRSLLLVLLLASIASAQQKPPVAPVRPVMMAGAADSARMFRECSAAAWAFTTAITPPDS